MARRLRGRYGYPADEPFRVTLHPDRLEQPAKWRKPRRVFVCSMGDLFHPDVPLEFISEVWTRMSWAPEHRFLILTKRPERMRDVLAQTDYFTHQAGYEYLLNVWLGVTAENQARADERIPILLSIPAAVRFVSIEPMLGPVDLRPTWIRTQRGCGGRHSHAYSHDGGTPGHILHHHHDEFCGPRLDWVIVGGETGPGARPLHPDWVRNVRDQCVTAGVPFFLKQNGEWSIYQMKAENERIYFKDPPYNGLWFYRVGKKVAGRKLDGKEWNEYPNGEADGE
jgi:protein gp37